MSKQNHNLHRFLPLIVAAGLIVGILIGSFCAHHFAGNRLSIINTSSNKLGDLLHIINDRYVDDVDMADFIEKAIPRILAELDPHSTYVTAKDVENEMQDLKGSFSGIGVIFTILEDTPRVVRVVEDGPSEEVGLLPGDRIVTVDGKKFTGPEITNDSAMATLKGPKNSVVKLGIKRAGAKNTLFFSIVRGDIPVKSIECVYMIDKTTGYICIKSFSETTYAEMLRALATLNHEGFKNLIIDLRDNHGGYMTPAIQIANEFLPKNRLIVYTEGRKVERQEFHSDGHGSYRDIPLVLLVNETSASSAEVLTGAIQDNDRGTIIGRRTFGKGLVQEPISFQDNSMLRLTIARYYSPSGRCLQKPYEMGKGEDYELDIMHRAESGEFLSADSIRQQGKAFQTYIGRTVYDGGGITPDHFIPADTLGVTSYFQEALYQGLLPRFAYKYVDEHRAAIAKLGGKEDFLPYFRKQNVLEQFVMYAERQGLKRRNLMIQTSRALLEDFLVRYMIDDFYGPEAMMWFSNQNDPCILKALDVFAKGEASPTLEQGKAAVSTARGKKDKK